jgi:multiple sugar transport system substrate-binding protein
MRVRVFTLIGILVLLGAIFVACAPAEPQIVEKTVLQTVVVEKEVAVEKEVEVVVTATPVPLGAPVKMSFWMNYNFVEAVNLLFKVQAQEWAQANNVDLDILIAADADLHTKWSAGLEAPNTLPDVSVIFAQWQPRFYDAGLLVDVSDVYAELDSMAGGFMPAAREGVTVLGKQYAIPFIGSASPAYWRVDKLEEAGLTEPPKTYAEVLDWCKKVNKPGEFWCYGLAFSGYSDTEVEMRHLLWSYGAKLVEEDGKTIALDSPETRAALQWIIDMKDAGSFPPDAAVGDDVANNKWYQTRMVGFVANTGSILNWIRTNDEELLEMTMMTHAPGGPAGIHGKTGFGSGIGVFSSTQNPELAKSLVTWLVHPDRVWARVEAINYGNMPVHVDSFKDPIWQDPFNKAFVEQLQYGHPTGWPGPTTTAAYEVQSQRVIGRMALRLLTGEQDIEQTIAQAVSEIETIYAEFPPKL